MSRKRFKKLFEPLQVGRVRFRNRIVSAPHALFYENEGFVEERTRTFYEAVAKGGAGMITISCFYVEPYLNEGEPHPRIDDDKYIPALADLTKAIHKHGCPVFLQLGHPGPIQRQAVTGSPPLAASALSKEENPFPFYDLAKEITVAEIKELVEKMTLGAERARKAGFDGVEIHVGHCYLLNSFLSRAWNQRQDEYGCQSLENRARFAVEIIRSIKETVGKDFPVGFRMNGEEWGLEKGITTVESQGFGKIFEEAGADYLSVTGFSFGRPPFWQFPEMILYPETAPQLTLLAGEIKKPGVLIKGAAAIKKVVSIPVMGVGRLTPELGEWLLEKDMIDLVVLGRPLMADPELPNKLAFGRMEDIRHCLACHECHSLVRRGQPVRCRINAALGEGPEFEIKQAETRKRVVVIGSGPAGLEAARVAALRGHKVLLYEKELRLGGLLPLAALVKGLEIEDLVGLVRYFKTQLNKLGVKVRLGKEFTPAVMEKIQPDVVILATGGKLTVPEISGINRSNVVSASDLHRKVRIPLTFLGPRLLRELTRFWLPLGESVVVIGGSMQGCEVAEFLVKRGRKVTIVEESDQLGTGLPEQVHRQRLLGWLAGKGVAMLTEVKYEEITDKGLTVIDREGEKQTINADAFLLTLPSQENTELFKALEGKAPEVHLIGDARESDLIVGAIHEGSRIARLI